MDPLKIKPSIEMEPIKLDKGFLYTCKDKAFYLRTIAIYYLK